MATQLLNVRILTPKQTLFEGEALSVSSKNSSGKFDILPQHANFLTLVENQLLTVIKQNKEKLTLNLVAGVIYVESNQVHIYTDILSSI